MQRRFAPGVTLETYYDAEKTNKNDTQLCWAAVSANLIAWWQDRYESGAPKKRLSDSLARTAQTLFEQFKKYWYDADGTFLNGILWYMASAASCPADAGGYLLDYIDKSKWSYPVNRTAYTYRESFASLEDFSSVLLSGLKNGAAALGISNRSASGVFGHAITIWGAEYNPDTNVISALWVADSDDRKTALVKYAISQASGYVKIDYGIYPYDKIKNIMILYAP